MTGLTGCQFRSVLVRRFQVVSLFQDNSGYSDLVRLAQVTSG